RSSTSSDPGNRRNEIAALDPKGSVNTQATTTFKTGPEVKVDWPTRPVTIVVPFPPGGSADIVARVLGQGLTRSLGQTVIIENRAGANGTVALESVAKSAPDGYRIVIGTSGTNAQAPSLYKKLSYNTLKDFTPVALV